MGGLSDRVETKEERNAQYICSIFSKRLEKNVKILMCEYVFAVVITSSE